MEHLPGDPLAEDQTFQKRVAGQPVRAVDAGRRHLPGGVQPSKRGTPLEIGRDPSDHVVGDGGHRDTVAGRVKAVREQEAAYGGESGVEAVARDLGGVEVDVGVPRPRDLAVDRPSDHVPGRELGILMLRHHESLPRVVAQDGAFPAKRLGDQEPRRPLAVEGGRVELDELHVAEQRPGPERDRDPLTGRDRRVRALSVERPGPAGGEDHRARVQDLEPPALGVRDGRLEAVPTCRGQRPEDPSLEHLYPGVKGPMP